MHQPRWFPRCTYERTDYHGCHKSHLHVQEAPIISTVSATQALRPCPSFYKEYKIEDILHHKWSQYQDSPVMPLFNGFILPFGVMFQGLYQWLEMGLFRLLDWWSVASLRHRIHCQVHTRTFTMYRAIYSVESTQHLSETWTMCFMLLHNCRSHITRHTTKAQSVLRE